MRESIGRRDRLVRALADWSGARLRGVAAVAAVAASVGLPQAAGAADLQLPPSIVGDCLLTGGTLSTSPALPAAPGPSVTVTLSASGTCVSNHGVNTVSVSLSGSGVVSCLGGTASLFGTFTWNDGQPPSQVSGVISVEAPGAMVTLAFPPGVLDAVALLAWSNPVQLATCPLGGVSSASLAGDMVFSFG